MLRRIGFLLRYPLTIVFFLGLPWIEASLPWRAEDAQRNAISPASRATAAEPEGANSPSKTVQKDNSAAPTAAKDERPNSKAASIARPFDERPATEASAKPAAALAKAAPESVEDLIAIQKAIQEVAKKCMAATVAVEINGVEGSGVIVSEDGYVLTAGHVSGAAGRDVIVKLPNGKDLRAKTLGANEAMDSGMIKITDSGSWSHVEMGRSGTLRPGDWCVAIGHPGGFQHDRPPVVRAGRVILVRNEAIWTDCPLMAGDSGGPLFDSQGRLIGIHSRISDPIIDNYHVPIDTYRDTWDRLAKGETWGGPPPRGGPMLGVSGETHEKGCQLVNVFEGTPAAKAGLKVDDIITQVSGETVKGIEGLQSLVAKHKVGEEITLTVLRGGEKLELKTKLAKRE
jgi:serine protease Do